MAKQLKAKKLKTRTYQYYVFNIKLQSNERGGDDAYYEMLTQIYNENIEPIVGSEKAMALKTQFTVDYIFNHKKHKVLYGKLVRYTVLDEDHWYNRRTKQFEKYAAPEDVFPNGYETDYVFIPAAHRFYFAVNSKVSIVATETFLNKALKKVIGHREDIKVNLIQSTDTFEEIINSKQIKSLKINVSYTNDDVGKEAAELMDQFLKEAQIGEAEAVFKPDQNGTLNTESKMVSGFLGVAKENGTAEATIIKEDGRQKKIVTTNYPEKRPVTVAENEVIQNKLFTDVMGEYRDGAELEL